ncbi:hypothetical protein SAMN05421747_104221 [Parapedobacter composti]|uniref:Uncharacterized protein n=1 Tax=Parapedobacter composti TaxID=623281 RepID=A0A1I1GN07_9SPHI|nr:hypothetical protein SAMN05421747_104221 [Parapedobacter composti]
MDVYLVQPLRIYKDRYFLNTTVKVGDIYEGISN